MLVGVKKVVKMLLMLEKLKGLTFRVPSLLQKLAQHSETLWLFAVCQVSAAGIVLQP
jgi:hypothetical protein